MFYCKVAVAVGRQLPYILIQIIWTWQSEIVDPAFRKACAMAVDSSKELRVLLKEHIGTGKRVRQNV